MDWEREGGMLKAVVGKSLLGNNYFDSVVGRLRVSEVAPLMGLTALLPRGTLEFDIQEVELQGMLPSAAQGTVVWRDAGLNLLRGQNMGSFSLKLDTTNQGIEGIVRDTEGPLAVDARLLVDTDGNYQLTGSAHAKGDASAELNQALRRLGAVGKDGKIILKYSGHLTASQ